MAALCGVERGEVDTKEPILSPPPPQHTPASRPAPKSSLGDHGPLGLARARLGIRLHWVGGGWEGIVHLPHPSLPSPSWVLYTAGLRLLLFSAPPLLPRFAPCIPSIPASRASRRHRAAQHAVDNKTRTAQGSWGRRWWWGETCTKSSPTSHLHLPSAPVLRSWINNLQGTIRPPAFSPAASCPSAAHGSFFLLFLSLPTGQLLFRCCSGRLREKLRLEGRKRGKSCFGAGPEEGFGL